MRKAAAAFLPWLVNLKKDTALVIPSVPPSQISQPEYESSVQLHHAEIDEVHRHSVQFCIAVISYRYACGNNMNLYRILPKECPGGAGKDLETILYAKIVNYSFWLHSFKTLVLSLGKIGGAFI